MSSLFWTTLMMLLDPSISFLQSIQNKTSKDNMIDMSKISMGAIGSGKRAEKCTLFHTNFCFVTWKSNIFFPVSLHSAGWAGCWPTQTKRCGKGEGVQDQTVIGFGLCTAQYPIKVHFVILTISTCFSWWICKQYFFTQLFQKDLYWCKNLNLFLEENEGMAVD